MRTFNVTCVALAVLLIGACQTTGGDNIFDDEPARRWVGVIAVEETTEVLDLVEASQHDPAVYGMAILHALNAGLPGFVPAVGTYCLIPYDEGEPYERPECHTTQTGIWTMWAPAEMVQPDVSMCVEVPDDWPGIAEQQRYPEVGGPRLACRDFGVEAVGTFAATRETAAMIPVIKPDG